MLGLFQSGAITAAVGAAVVAAFPAAAQVPIARPLEVPPQASPGSIEPLSWIRPPRPTPPPMDTTPVPLAAGAVELTCTSQTTGDVTDCSTTYETRPDSDLDVRVLDSLVEARLSPAIVDGVPQPSVIRFGVRFPGGTREPIVSRPLPPAPVGDPAIITEASWARQPTPDYPERALEQNVASGHVTVLCGFIASGDISDCEIVSEAPTDMGFGRAVLRSMQRATLAQAAVRDAPAGSRIQFSTNFAMR